MIELKIDKNDVLKYLGYNNQKLDLITSNLIDDSIEKVRHSAEVKYIYNVFSIDKGKEISLKDTNLILKGEDIKKHLENSNSCIIMAATLGHKVDKLIRYYTKLSQTQALILDAAASAAIEEICDNLNENFEKEYLLNSKTLTSRFSPGYGDLNLNIQNAILNILNAKKSIGLTATFHNILIPRKSVTAIIGIMDKNFKKQYLKCEECTLYNNCLIKKAGGKCGR